MLVQYYIDDRYAGHADIPFILGAGGPAAPFSLGLFCNECGELWGRMLGAPHRGWQLLCHLCPRCGYGSMWNTVWPEYDRAMPKELLEREFLLYLAHGWFTPHKRRERDLPEILAENPQEVQSLNEF